MDTSNLKAILDNVKTIDWSSALVSFFIVKRKLEQRRAKYEGIRQVKVEEKLRKKLRGVVAKKNRTIKRCVGIRFHHSRFGR